MGKQQQWIHSPWETEVLWVHSCPCAGFALCSPFPPGLLLCFLAERSTSQVVGQGERLLGKGGGREADVSKR